MSSLSVNWVAVLALGISLGSSPAMAVDMGAILGPAPALKPNPGVAVDFTLSGPDGVSHKLSGYRGKWVVVNFWATWCSPCLEEIPELIKFHDRHKDRDAVVLGIDYEDIDAGQLRAFVKRHGLGYPVLQADPAEPGPFGDVPALPVTFLISPQGELVERHTGPVTATMLESYIRRKTAVQAAPATPR